MVRVFAYSVWGMLVVKSQVYLFLDLLVGLLNTSLLLLKSQLDVQNRLLLLLGPILYVQTLYY